MKLRIVSIPKSQKEPLANIYRNGTLSLNRAMFDALELKNDKEYHVSLALDDKNGPDKKLYLVFQKETDRSSRKLIITTKSCTVNFTRTFDELGLDYKKNEFQYYLEKLDSWEGRRVVVLARKQ